MNDATFNELRPDMASILQAPSPLQPAANHFDGADALPKHQKHHNVDPLYSAFDVGLDTASAGLDVDLEFFQQICGDDVGNNQPQNLQSGLGRTSHVFVDAHYPATTPMFSYPHTPQYNQPISSACFSPLPPMTHQSTSLPSPNHSHYAQQQQQPNFGNLPNMSLPNLLGTPAFHNYPVRQVQQQHQMGNYEQFRTASRQAISAILAASSPNVSAPAVRNGNDSLLQLQDFASTASTLEYSSQQYQQPTLSSRFNSASEASAYPLLFPTPNFNNTNKQRTSPLQHSSILPPPQFALREQNVNIYDQTSSTNLPFPEVRGDACELANQYPPFPAVMAPDTSNLQLEDEDGDYLDGPDTTVSTNLATDAAASIPITAVKTESGKSVFVCPWEGCGRQFTRPYNLRSHYRQHTGERPFVCGQCPMSFSRHHDLKRHTLIHGVGKQHTCPACSRSFLRSDALKRHLKPTGDDSRLSKCMQIIQIKGLPFEGY